MSSEEKAGEDEKTEEPAIEVVAQKVETQTVVSDPEETLTADVPATEEESGGLRVVSRPEVKEADPLL